MIEKKKLFLQLNKKLVKFGFPIIMYNQNF